MTNRSLQSKTMPVSQTVFFILGVWIFYLLILGLLQVTHLPFGFKVWPLGEDRNWIKFMHDGPGLKMLHLFWQTDWRNPLSAWWWWLVSPFVKASDWALYLVRKCIDPLLAVVTFLLLDRLGKQQCRSFAISVALIVLFWNFSAYYEQILWDFQLALFFNLLAIYFYCYYLDTQRQTGSYLALALIAYLIAIATYTLQSGGIIAIFFLALFRQDNLKGQKKSLQFFASFQDTFFFLAIFVIYNCIWYTVSPYADVFYKFDLSLFGHQVLVSLQQFLYHTGYAQLVSLIQSDWSAGRIVFIFSLSVVFAILVYVYARKRCIITDDIKFPLAWIIIILIAIALPTMLVEATSNTWYPGTRSVMVQQVWQPLLYVSIIFFLTNIFPRRYVRFAQKITLASVIFLMAVTLLAGLDYNYRLVLRTHYQKVLVKELKKLIIPPNIQPYFLVKFMDAENSDLNTVSVLIKGYAETMMKQNNVFLRAFQSVPNPAQASYWIVRFNKNDQGVINAAEFGNNSPVPYSNIWIVFFDGKKLWIPVKVSKNDFIGLQVDWQRDTDIDQTDKAR